MVRTVRGKKIPIGRKKSKNVKIVTVSLPELTIKKIKKNQIKNIQRNKPNTTFSKSTDQLIND